MAQTNLGMCCSLRMINNLPALEFHSNQTKFLWMDKQMDRWTHRHRDWLY